MTRTEMESAIDVRCDEYPMCCGNSNGDCPIWKHKDECGRSLCIDLSSKTDEEVKALYELMFNGVPIASNPVDNPFDNPVTHPSHYTQGKVQCIEAMESAFGKEAVATWAKLNAFKYIWRAEHKNGMEDIDKAIWYLNKFKELTSSE